MYGITLDFENRTFQCNHHIAKPEKLLSQNRFLNILVLDDGIPQIGPCSVKESQEMELEMPQKYYKALESVLNDYAALFWCQLCRPNVTKHVIDISDATPVKLPLHLIIFYFSGQVQRQLKNMAQERIIRPSNSSWCAPADYVQKNNGEIRTCVDFVQLNKTTKSFLSCIVSRWTLAKVSQQKNILQG